MNPFFFRSSRRKPGPSPFVGHGALDKSADRTGWVEPPKALGPGFRRDERTWKNQGLGIALALSILTIPAFAQEPAAPPDRPLASAQQEARAQALFDVLRCVVCQHESIADSPAGIAGDMRRLVREQIAAGASDDQIKADMVRRYGDYVLFQPPVTIGTWLLWFGPLVLVLGGGGLLLVMSRRRAVEAPALTPDEERRLGEVLQSDRSRRDADASSPHDGRSMTATGVPDDVGTPAHRPISDESLGRPGPLP